MREALALHRDLLALRRSDPVIASPRAACRWRGAGDRSVRAALRRAADGDDRLLLVNLGADLDLTPLPEPLLAPPRG